MVLNHLSLSEHIQRHSVWKPNAYGYGYEDAAVMERDDNTATSCSVSGSTFSIDDSFAQFQLGALKTFQSQKTVGVVETEMEATNLLPTLEESLLQGFGSEHSSIFVFEDEREDERQKLTSGLSSRSFVSSCDSRCSYRPQNDLAMTCSDEDESLKDLDITVHQDLEDELCDTKGGNSNTKHQWKMDPLDGFSFGKTTFVRNVQFIQKSVGETTFSRNISFLQRQAKQWTAKVFSRVSI